MMPFDGNPRDFEPPMAFELRLLDRAYDLIATEEQWMKGQLSGRDRHTGRHTYCLYGAVREAERQLAPHLPPSIIFPLGNTILHVRTQAFVTVHECLNEAARPWLQMFSDSRTFAMHLNDNAGTVREVHRVIVSARRKLEKRLARITA